MPSVYSFKVELWIEYTASAALCFFRFAARLKLVGLRSLQIDDWLVLFALAIYTIEVSMAHVIVVITGGTNSGLTDAQREEVTLPAHAAEYAARVLGSKAFLIGWLCYAGCVWSLKLCMAAIFSRITDGLPRHKLMKYAVGYIFITFTIVVFILFLNCRPLSHYWQINPNPGTHCTFQNGIPFATGLALNISSDLMLIFIPLPVILGASIDLKRKIALTVLFSAAGFIMVAGTLRVVFFFTSPQDPTLPAIWSCRETFVSFWVTNAPVMAPLARREFWKGRARGYASHNDSAYPNSRSKPVELSSQGFSKSATTRDSIYGSSSKDIKDFESESTEHIIETPDKQNGNGPLVIRRQMKVDVISEHEGSLYGGPELGQPHDSSAGHTYRVSVA